MTNTNQSSSITEEPSSATDDQIKDKLIEAESLAMTLAFGQWEATVAAFAPGAKVSFRPKRYPTSWVDREAATKRGLWHQDLTNVASIDGFALPSGCGVILGPANVGKTPLLKHFVGGCGDKGVLIRFGEPLPGYHTRESEALAEFLAAMLNPNVKVIGIDSIKDLLSTMDGALMARGVPRSVFRLLSQWGSVASALGKLIVVPLNISTDDDKALAEVQAAVLSNTTIAMVAQPSNSVRYFARTGEGKRRRVGAFTIQWGDEGVKRIGGFVNAKDDTESSNFSIAVEAASLSNDALAGSIARALRTN